MPRKKRGVFARLKAKMGVDEEDLQDETKPPVKPKKKPTMGGYADPGPRKKVMENIFDYGLKKRKDNG